MTGFANAIAWLLLALGAPVWGALVSEKFSRLSLARRPRRRLFITVLSAVACAAILGMTWRLGDFDGPAQVLGAPTYLVALVSFLAALALGSLALGMSVGALNLPPIPRVALIVAAWAVFLGLYAVGHIGQSGL